ncbi:S-adenosylmethionine:tRNA ribosyltransferase-isomerase [Nocardioides sp. B-3]|uniref:S-adenosylmethionine:tRNA ribosyltransferase-isomerase n=1 Tax=Nocardioides sp. B-3 TaxID=2895565 RepID=UPI002152072D|nr:S-adenosylmethionine:tRNA ribosyltransferase-isomerase [Nocardioides sp. B-3]UUZ57718.1 S-adenosylmethionine:tRNA ribosyltransferase-isomerase [Nocardioides sp. B-3]
MLDAVPGDVVQVGDVRVTLAEPPADDLVADREGEQALAGAGPRRPGCGAGTCGETDRLRLPRPSLSPRPPTRRSSGPEPGSAEMASAGRPFTEALVTTLVASGIAFAPVTLHTGVSSREAGEAPGPEWFEVPESSARLINAARAGGGRVVAVGTTATRAIESAVRDGAVVKAGGWTDRIITPAARPQVVDGLITGWHDPHASHLLLVEAVAGRALTQAAYDAAVENGYLWHEFGDSALLLP